MIYARRELQQRLNELRSVLDSDAIDKLVKRLNLCGKDRVAAMWELVVLHGLSKCGYIQNEITLSSLRKPDIFFEHNELRFIADVTAVSDEGLNKDNPYEELMEMIRIAKDKLKLPIGGLTINIKSRREETKRGTRIKLLLPTKNRLQEFVDKVIVPKLIEKVKVGTFPFSIEIKEDGVNLNIIIDSVQSPYNSCSFACYDLPRIKDRNPLYNALKNKASQLKGVSDISGVIVGDNGCAVISNRISSFDSVSIEQIVNEFFRQFLSVDFILLLSIREHQDHSIFSGSLRRKNHISLFVRTECKAKKELEDLFEKMVEHFPTPIMMPINGARRACEDDYYLGYHGAYNMEGSKIVRIGLREFTEILAGLKVLQDNGARYVDASRKLPQEPNQLQDLILKNFKEGRLPETINIIKTPKNDDDWVEISFGERDPAISPFQ
ncbi:hypothetical protein A9G13_01790 [Gilliamella sp. wkB178]|uniref:hypothetical protein n=1 Tax=Gilliamella sp. wkB178 TaxID=3120259 RepID=UPI00080E7DD3|nr:hypothetical protein [Gilliamella apicola]OCG08818.1 hypothetical protein A9G13_01790 [Gilliamella apicola]